jgi:hypothetical protein
MTLFSAPKYGHTLLRSRARKHRSSITWLKNGAEYYGVKYSSRMERMESAALPDWEEERFQLERSGAVRGENDGDFVPDEWAQPSLFESLGQLQVFNISPAGRE